MVFTGKVVMVCSLPQGQGRDKHFNFACCDQFRLSDGVVSKYFCLTVETTRNIVLVYQGIQSTVPILKNFWAFKIVAAHGDIVGHWPARKGVASHGLQKAVRVHLQVQRIEQVFVGKLLI